MYPPEIETDIPFAVLTFKQIKGCVSGVDPFKIGHKIDPFARLNLPAGFGRNIFRPDKLIRPLTLIHVQTGGWLKANVICRLEVDPRCPPLGKGIGKGHERFGPLALRSLKFHIDNRVLLSQFDPLNGYVAYRSHRLPVDFRW